MPYRTQPPTRCRSRSDAFSLVEMLVVVTIIVALLAILMPSMGGAIAAAHLATCQSNVRQISFAHTVYAQDNNALYPNKHTYLTTLGISPGTFASVPTKSVLVVGGYLEPGAAVKIFLCPVDPLTRNGGWNPITPPSFSYCRNAESQGGAAYVDVTLMRNPTQHAMLLEEWELGPMNDGNFWGNAFDVLTQRHAGRASIAYFDNHAETTDAATYNGQTYDWRIDNFLDPLYP